MIHYISRFIAALALLATAQGAWATETSTITVNETDYTLFTGFTATDGNGRNYAKLVDGNTSTDWSATKNYDDPNAPANDFAGGTDDPAFVEFHADEAFIPKGYVLTCYHENAGFWKPVEWALKAKLNEGDAWTTIHSSTTTLGAGKTFEIACDNDGDNEYQYFRFEVYEVGTTRTVDLDELQFYGSLPAYTHLTVKAATCMATGIKVDCYRRNSDGKYFTDNTGETEIPESDVIAPIIPHTGEHHEATDVNIEYWQCSMCGKYFSDEGYTTEITEEQTKIYRTITIDSSISGLVTVYFGYTQALAGETIALFVSDLIDASTLKVNNGAVELTAVTDIQYTFTMPAADVTVTADVAQSNADGDVLTGSIRHTVTIPDGASITLNNATITGSIVCEGSATITLVGTNSVSGATNKAGIQIGGSGTTLTINGDGTLTANGGSQSAGIGLSRAFNVTEDVVGGNIVINGGNITANGGGGGAGIGAGVTKDPNNSSSRKAIVGTITIAGGSVTAVGGSNADGIGAGENNYNATIQIGTVTIYDGIDKVDASSIKDFASVVYMHGETNVTASKTDYFAIGEDGNRRLIAQKPAIAEIPDQTYTGSEITPEPQVTIGSLSLTKSTDYEYSYTNNTNVGTATVRATFQGDYESLGYVEKTFTIAKATPTVTAPTAIADLVYNGSPQALVTAGSTDFGTLIYSTDGANYSADIPTATDAGTYTVYYKVEEGDNWYAVAAQTVEVTAIPWSGTGDLEDPYMIYNKDQLLLLAHRVNGTNGETANTYEGMYFKLGADITFSPDDLTLDEGQSNYEAIGGYYDGSTTRFFKGQFDGANHTVSGIRICKDGSYDDYSNQGLFGYIGIGAEIYDVHLTDARFTGYECVGGIAGYNEEGFISGCSVTDSYITATGDYYGTICGFTTITDRLSQNYYHGCTVNGTAVTSGKGCQGADIADYNGALPAYRLVLGANITTPPGTFASQSEWLDTPPVDPRLAPENGFTLAGNHYFASGYKFTPGSTLASGAAQGYTPRATLGDELLAPYTPTGDADPLAGTAIAQFTVTADCDGKTLASTQAIYSTGQPVTVAYVNADGTPGEASAIALDGTETSLAAGTYFAGLENVNFDHTVNLNGDVTLILKDGCAMNVGTSESRIDGYGIIGYSYTLDIYAQSLGDDMGALSIYNTGSNNDGIKVKAPTVNGGNITADANGSDSRAINATTSNLTINGGNVTANSANSIAIRSAAKIYINGGTVNVTGSTYGISGSSLVEINGGTVNGTCTGSGYGIRASGSVAINGGNVTASSIFANSGTITLGWSKPTDRITASSYSGTVQVADDKKLHNGSTFLYGTLDDPAAVNGKTLRPAATATYTTADGTTATADAILLDASDNSLPAGNYLATGTLNYTHGITLNGNVTLILADNCHMNVGTSGSRINDNCIDGCDNLEIYGQANGTGALSVYVAGELSHAINEGTVTIYGGNITADADGNSSAAIYAEDGLTVNRGIVSATAIGNDCSGIYSIAGSVAINGGTVTAGGAYVGIYAETDVNISGGNVTATSTNGTGIEAGNGTITLGWTKPTDRITASSYSGTVTLARLFTDAADPADNYYGGTYTGDALAALAGKTLSGTTEVTLTEDNATQALAAINGMSGIGVTFNRAFTASKPSTICLPFDYTKKEGDGSFYAFTSIEHSGSEYIATMTEPGTETLTANTPYLYLPSATGNVEFSGMPTKAIAAGTTTSGDWTFQGTYDEVKWDTAPTGIYGFSAQDVSAQGISQGISQGEFVKVGAKVRIRPLRAYLKYKNGTENYSAAPTRGTTAELPDRIIVRLIGSDGNTTAIGTLDTRTGEVEIDTWYDLNGRKLSAKPTHRGIYINNGRKVAIK